MSATVFWGSPRQTQLDARETLPAKLDLILERLRVRERVKGQRVATEAFTIEQHADASKLDASGVNLSG